MTKKELQKALARQADITQSMIETAKDISTIDKLYTEFCGAHNFVERLYPVTPVWCNAMHHIRWRVTQAKNLAVSKLTK